MKKKIKILSILLAFGVCFSFALNSAKVKATNNFLTAKTLKENQIKGYELEQTVKKGDIKFLIYRHKKSGALALVHNMPVSSFSGMFFSNIATDNSGAIHAIDHFLAYDLNKKFKKKYGEEIEYIYYLSSHGSLISTQNFENGIGLKININTWTDYIIENLTNELKNPTFLKKDEKNLNREKNRIFLELKEKMADLEKQIKPPKTSVKDYNLYKKLTDRFVGGKFKNGGEVEKIKELNFKKIEKEFKKICVPQNLMVVVNVDRNKNYKNILENLSEKYFNFYEQKKEQQPNLKKVIENKPFRKETVNQINYIENEKNIKKLNYYIDNEKKIKKSKYIGRVYWDVSALSKQKKQLLNLKDYEFLNITKSCLKEMGYSFVNYINAKMYNTESGYYNPLIFDDLIYLDFYGDDENLFKKEVLIENAKKLFKNFIEKAEKLNEDDLTNLSVFSDLKVFDENDREYIDFNLNENLEYEIVKSFGISKNPFNEKYFDLNEKGELKHIAKSKNFFKDFKNIKNNFNFFLENKPKYVDVFSANGEKNYENKNFYTHAYKYPIKFNLNSFKKNEISFLENIAKKLIFDDFFKENIFEKGLVYQGNFISSINLANHNKKEVENYIFGQFKKEFKNYKPKEKDFEFYKNQEIEDLNFFIRKDKELVKEIEDLLKNNQKIKTLAKKQKDSASFEIKNMLNELKTVEKILLNSKKGNKNLKKRNENLKKQIKELEQNKNKLEFFENRIKNYLKTTNDEINKELKSSSLYLNIIKNINFNQILKVFENAKFNEKNHLEDTGL